MMSSLTDTSKGIGHSNTAVLIVGFNRPELFSALLDRVISWSPRAIYVSIDGPRPGNADDASANREILSLVSAVQKVRPVELRNSPVNAGCRDAVSGAIDWFFSNEESGIILEDDCMPDPSFYDYCSELLKIYADYPSVLSISGYRAKRTPQAGQHSYLFSKYPQIWGWATWRRVWSQYDAKISDWPEGGVGSWLPDHEGLNWISRKFWSNRFSAVHKGLIDTWDYQFTFLALRQRGLTIIPSSNMVKNVGFDERATHTSSRVARRVNDKVANVTLPLNHPAKLEQDVGYDRWLESRSYRMLRSVAFHFLKALFSREQKRSASASCSV